MTSKEMYAKGLKKQRLKKEIGFDTFGTDIQDSSSLITSMYGGWQSKEDMDKAKASIQSSFDRLGAYQSYQQQYGGADLSDIQNAYKFALDNWDDLAFDYGNYKSADEYNKANKEAEDRNNYLSTVSITDLQAQLDDVNKQKSSAKSQLSSADYNFKKLDNGRNKPKYGVSPEAHSEAKTAYDSAKNAYFGLEENASNLQRDITLATRAQSLNALTAEAQKARGYDPEAGTAIAQGKMLADKATKETSETWNPGTQSSMTSYTDNAKDTKQLIEFGTDAEKDAYYYYLGTGQTDKAKEYRDGLKESLNAREGRQWRKDADTYIEKLGVAVRAGLEQFGSGIEGALNFSGRYIPTKPSQYAAQEVRQQLTQDENYLGRLGFDVVNTGANMAPSIALGFANPIAGTAAMGVSAGGNEYQNMINQGYSQGQAYTMGVLTGASEALLQKAIGGIGALGGTSAKVANAVSSMRSGLAKFALRWGGSMASEALEEGAQEILAPIFKSIATGEDVESVDWGEVAYSALLGGLLGVGEGVSIGANVIGENRVGKAIKGNERINDVFDMASLSPEESQAYELYTRLADSGVTADNVSNAQLGSLASQIATDAQQTIKSKTATAEQKTSASKALSDIKVYAQKSAGAKLSKKEVKDLSAGDVTRLIGSGLESGKDTEAYKLATEYKKKLVGDGKLETKTVEASKVKLSEKEIRKLMDANASALKAETLASNPETESEQKTKALARYNAGEVLTEAEYKLLNGTETLEAAQKEVDSLSKVMDDVSAKLFTELYDGKVNQERYAEDFTRVMFYATRNYSDDYILKNSGVITPAQVSKIVSETITNNARQREASQKKAFEEMGGVFAHQADIDDSAVNYGDTPVKGKVNFNSLNMRQRNSIAFAMGLSRALGTDLVIEPDNPKYNGKFSKSTRKIYINAYAGKIDGQPFKNALIPALSHETTHRMELESPSLFRELSNIVFSTLEKSDGIEEAKRIGAEQARLDEESPKKNGKKHTEEEARSEIVARACEDMLSRSEKAIEMFSALTEEQQKGFVGTIRQIIAELKKAIRKLLATFKSDSYEASVLRNFEEELNEMQKLWDKMLENSVAANQVFKEQMLKGIDGKPIDPERITSNELDVEYSLKYNGDIAKGQLEYLEKNKAYISEEELKEAQKVTAAMVDVMIKHSSILPEDKIGKVLTKNGSYDRSVENTTICVRTLAYNEFIDMVQEEIGRPLTQMESFLVSQKLYDIATEPQCLYCYVSLDRKAFNEMLLRYMHDRDTVIAKYNESDKTPDAISKLYEEFLNGRKDTKEMKSRFDKWIGYVDNGTKLLSLADIATEERQSVIKSEGGNLSEQLSDARKYAQSASWSKIQKNYVAYRDEILKLGNQVIKNLNEHYGLRWYSFSDYSAAFIVENMQQITDASIRGLKGLAYTKDTDFVEIFAPSGMNVNISVFVNQDADGNFYIDEKQSANFEKAKELRAKYPNVGIVATVTNDDALKWAGEQEWSDVIIPFHIVRTGTDIAEYYKWLNYTSESGDTIKDKDLWNAYVDSLNPKTENARKKVSKNIYPSEHKNDKDTYLALCESRGLNPRFVRFAGESWYMKLVNETRLSADDSSVLKPIFNEDAAKASFDKFVDKGGYEGGWYKEGVDVDKEAKVVASDVLAGKKANEVDYGRQDNFNPEELVASRKKQRTHSNELSVDEDVQFSDKVTEITEDDYKNIKNHFGTTGNYNVAGYMLADGKMLDFSGKHWGDTSSTFRQVDHRDIQEVLDEEESGVQSMVRMIGNGNIRLMPETGGINLAVKPSKNQRIVLRRYIEYMSRKEGIVVDIDEVGGDTIKSFEYDKGVTADRVMRDIDNYFKGGTQSELMKFHAMGDDVQFSEKSTVSYTDEEYRAYGWARENGILNAGQNADYRTKFAKAVSGQGKFNKSKSGEYIIPVSDIYNSDFEGINNVLVFAKGTIDNPKITSIIVIDLANETELDIERKKIYELQRRGIQPKNALLFRRYDAVDFRIRHKGDSYENGGNSFNHEFGKRSGEKAAEAERTDEIKYSDKNTESIYDLMGESERLAEENKKLAADVELLKERLKLEKTITHGKYAKSSTLLNAASVILGKAQSKYSKVDLAKRIGDVYTYIASDPDVSAQGIFDRLYPIAEDVLAEAKVEVEVDYAIKGLLKDLKKTRISLDNAQIAEMEYRFGKDWRKRFFNKIIIAEDGISLDSKWQEWAENIPAYFDADINSADQIGALYDLIDTLKEASERVIEYDHAEQARWLAEEIYNQFWNITPYESTADKYEKKISELKSKHKQMMTELRSKRDAREKQRLEEQKTLEAMYYGRRLREKDIEKEKAVADQRLADDIHYGKIIRKIDIKNTQERDKQKLADHMYYGRLIHNLRTRRENEVAQAKELGKQKLSEYKENAEKKTRIQRITATALDLNEYLVKNSKDKHINEDLKGPVIQLITAIDFSSKRMLEGGEPTKQDERLSKAFSKVKEMFVDASNGKEGLNDLYGHGLDEDIKKMIESVERIVDSLGGKDLTLNMMTLEDLQTLDKVMRTVKAAVNNVNKFHVAKHAEGIANLSRATMGYLNELGQTILHKGLRGKLDKLLNWNNALPYYVFKRYGVGGRVIFRALMDGQDKLAFNVKQIIDYAESTYTKDEIKEWDEEVKTFNIPVPKKKADSETEGQKTDDSAIEYQTIKMTVPQIMSLYCLTKREQARKHLFAGGIRVADFETKKGGIVSQTGNVIFTEEGVAQILDSLTERQKEVADKLQEFLNTVCPEWGNEVSMARFGYKAFGEKNYFPIYSDKNNLAVDDESDRINLLFRLLNMSFTKPTDDNANNTIIVSNIFDVFAQHTSDMAKYNALALPVLDTFKWYNYNEKEEIVDGKHKTHSVKQSIETAFGKDGQSYLMTFLRDINGQQESDRDSISKEFMRNFKIASVGMNLRVAALQPTSYLRAGAVIDNKYLVKAFAFKDKARGRAIDMAKKYCGIALWKSMGYYDTNIQRGVESQIKHDETWKDKAVEKSMYLAQKADEMTWGVLWNACELEIRDKRKDLEVGSEEFYETIGKRLREVIYATQVVDSVMTRSQMMRSTKLHDQIMTNFASEPTLGYNMLYDAYMSMALETRRTGSKKKAWEKHGKKIQRLAVSYTLTCTVTAAIEVAFDAFRNDDDEEKNLLLAWLTNFLSNMSITSKIPYIKELHSVIKGYRTSRSELAWVEDAWNAGNRISKLVQGKGDFEKTLRACLKALSELTGLPGFSAYRDGYALIETIGDFIE